MVRIGIILLSAWIRKITQFIVSGPDLFLPPYTRGEKKHLVWAGIKPRSSCFTSNHSDHGSSDNLNNTGHSEHCIKQKSFHLNILSSAALFINENCAGRNILSVFILLETCRCAKRGSGRKCNLWKKENLGPEKVFVHKLSFFTSFEKNKICSSEDCSR